MKLLLDENLSRRVIPFIKATYPDSSQVALLGLDRESDASIWEYAKRNDYVIVTRDSDFYELSVLRGQPPKIIWLRTGNQSKVAVIASLLDKHAEIARALATENQACVQIV